MLDGIGYKVCQSLRKHLLVSLHLDRHLGQVEIKGMTLFLRSGLQDFVD